MNTRRADDAQGTPAGWWLTPGPSRCEFCGQFHQVEAMLYCSHCDGIVCAVCVIVSIDRDPHCPVCQGEPEAG